ncbi:MAG: adenylosuccinate lyase family protein [Thermodesulfobacteriota bacterium]
MAVHPFDHQILQRGFSTPELLAVFEERTRLQRWLDVEAALAASQAELGVIPGEAAEEIAARAQLDRLDLTRLREEFARTRNSLVPLLRVLRASCAANYGEYVHFGATTQDVLDTAMVLEQRDALALIYRDLRGLASVLATLAERYRTTPMAGRTHGQQALPITFGFKCAVWLAETNRHLDRVLAMAAQLRYGQLGGAVGSLAAFGERALAVADRTLGRLGLQRPPISWHTSRDTIGALAGLFVLLLGTCDKIAGEIFQLGKTEIGELAETAPGRAMSSSTMPHKNNPVLCQRIAVLAAQGRALNTTVQEAAAHEHERDPRRLWSEWLAMPQLAVYTGTAVHSCRDVLQQLTVDEGAMADNLHRHGELLLSEWLQFQLADHLGKMRAQEKLHALIRETTAGGDRLAELLQKDPEIAGLDIDWQTLSHPERYLGQILPQIDAVLAETAARRHNDPKELFADGV